MPAMKAENIMCLEKSRKNDPCIYDPLIKEQKKIVNRKPLNAEELLKLGALYEEKLAMTNSVLKNKFFSKHIIPLTVAVFAPTYFLIFKNTHQILLSSNTTIMVTITSVTALIMMLVAYMAHIRYPKSGYKYFRKAIKIKPDLSEAIIFLGKISLRRWQKKNACRMFEQAIRIDGNNTRLEKQLKSIYEKEFFRFFTQQQERETKRLKEIKKLHREITKITIEKTALESQLKSTTGKAVQVKAKANRKIKLFSEKLADQAKETQKEFEKEIAALKKGNARISDEKEKSQLIFSRLTTEIIEAKAQGAKQSFKVAKNTVKDVIGLDVWQELSSQAKSYLATAEQTFIHLAEDQEEKDFSLIGMELCKALEFEINKVFVEPFHPFLGDKVGDFLKISHTGTRKNKPTYFTFLSRVVDQENFPKVTTLTLGQYLFILSQALNEEYSLQEYRNFLAEQKVKYGRSPNRSFLKKLDEVTNGYRNTIVHNSRMSKKQCEQLRNLVFAGEDALIKRTVGLNHKNKLKVPTI